MSYWRGAPHISLIWICINNLRLKVPNWLDRLFVPNRFYADDRFDRVASIRDLLGKNKGVGLCQFYANDDRLSAGMTQMAQTYMA